MGGDEGDDVGRTIRLVADGKVPKVQALCTLASLRQLPIRQGPLRTRLVLQLPTLRPRRKRTQPRALPNGLQFRLDLCRCVLV